MRASAGRHAAPRTVRSVGATLRVDRSNWRVVTFGSPGPNMRLWIFLRHVASPKLERSRCPRGASVAAGGRYVVEAVDEAPTLTPEEEAGLVEALEAI